MAVNTTHHLLTGIELLREHLGIQRWLVWGGSWGTTLALAYAQRHPQRVSEIVLASITMTRPAEVRWLYHGVGRFFLEEWARFRAGVPEPDRDGDLVAVYCDLLRDPDPEVRERAARDWCDWKDAVLSLEEGHQSKLRFQNARFRMAFARIVTHYFHHHAWLEDGVLLREAGRLAGIPGVLVHGRLDLGRPPMTAWELAQAWPNAELHLVNTGHMGGPEMAARLIAATDRFAELRAG